MRDVVRPTTALRGPVSVAALPLWQRVALAVAVTLSLLAGSYALRTVVPLLAPRPGETP